MEKIRKETCEGINRSVWSKNNRLEKQYKQRLKEK
jgi:hypothetical protein